MQKETTQAKSQKKFLLIVGDTNQVLEKYIRASHEYYETLCVMEQVMQGTPKFRSCFANYFEKDVMKSFLNWGSGKRSLFWHGEQIWDGSKIGSLYGKAVKAFLRTMEQKWTSKDSTMQERGGQSWERNVEARICWTCL